MFISVFNGYVLRACSSPKGIGRRKIHRPITTTLPLLARTKRRNIVIDVARPNGLGNKRHSAAKVAAACRSVATADATFRAPNGIVCGRLFH